MTTSPFTLILDWQFLDLIELQTLFRRKDTADFKFYKKQIEIINPILFQNSGVFFVPEC
jgi:hypothetical protein